MSLGEIVIANVKWRTNGANPLVKIDELV